MLLCCSVVTSYYYIKISYLFIFCSFSCAQILSNWYQSTFLGPMAGRRVEVLEERFEGEVGQLRTDLGSLNERFIAMEEKFGNLEEMLKRSLELQTKAADARGREVGQGGGGNHMPREDGEVEILEEEEGIPPLEPLPRRGMDREYEGRREWEDENMRAEFEGWGDTIEEGERGNWEETPRLASWEAWGEVGEIGAEEIRRLGS